MTEHALPQLCGKRSAKDRSVLDLWRDNMHLINTFHGQTELNMKRSGGIFSNHSRERSHETQNRLYIESRTVL